MPVPVSAIEMTRHGVNQWLAGFLFVGMLGGGGGCPYPSGIAINPVGLQRVRVESNDQYARTEFPTYQQGQALREEKRAKYGHTYAGVYHAGDIFPFKLNEKSYVLLSESKTILIFHGENIVKKIRLPRYMIWAEVLPIMLDGKEYLVIYVNQQSTRNTSTLLDGNLDVQYQEHLLGALALGHGSSERYGNYFVVEAGYEPDKRKDLQEQNVKWLYYLPQRNMTVGGPR